MATSPDGKRVIIKIADGKLGRSDVDGLIAYTENRYGEDEKVSGLQSDELVLSLMSNAKSGKSAKPSILELGMLPNGKSLFVEEFIDGKKLLDMVYPLREDFFDKYGRDLKTVYPENYENDANVLKSMLLMMFNDSLQTIKSMLETGVYSLDLKMHGDYLITNDSTKDMSNPKALEKNWRGVFVDWGVASIKLESERSSTAQKNLFAKSLRVHLDSSAQGLFSVFFSQSPALPKYPVFEEIRTPLENLLELTTKEEKAPQEDFLLKCKQNFDALNKAAENLGLNVRFEFPFNI